MFFCIIIRKRIRWGCPDRSSTHPHLRVAIAYSVPAITENAQQVDEQVDEVKIQRQRTHQSYFLCCLTSIGSFF